MKKRVCSFSLVGAATAVLLAITATTPAFATAGEQPTEATSSGVVSVDADTQTVTANALDGEQVSIQLPGALGSGSVDAASLSREEISLPA